MADKQVAAVQAKITQQAKKRFKEEYKELARFIQKHPIGSKLKITIDGKTFRLTDGNYDYPELNDDLLPITNFTEVKEDLVLDYEKQEVDRLTNQLSSISYLFERGEI
jgi:hypothetical protein